MDKPRVRIYLDNNPDPIIDKELPTRATLDTLDLDDGPHRLIIRAQDQTGRDGVEEIPFHVHNGPGILVAGLRPNSTRRGKVHFSVDAFSADDPFDPRRAEARSSVPQWVWVMCLFIVAWAVWYAASMWQVPAQFRDTPTYRAQPQATPAPTPSTTPPTPAAPEKSSQSGS